MSCAIRKAPRREQRAEFDARWLELREPVDRRSRAPELLPPLRAAWRRRGWSRILDLGCGTGSNLRYLAPRLPRGQEWTLLDRDPELLERAEPTGCERRVDRVCANVTSRGIDAGKRADLVTCSALLDLVSRRWLTRIVEVCRSGSRGAHFTLTYDGRIRWSRPADGSSSAADDAFVRDAVNAHQRRDKGIGGPALGPAAADVAAELFREAGHRTWLRPSSWRLGPRHRELARTLVDGWAEAATEQRPDRRARIRAWARRRRRSLTTGPFGLVVGHLDLLALPPRNGPPRR